MHSPPGKGTIRPLQAFRIAGLPTDVGAEIGDFDLMNYALPRIQKPLKKSQKYMARDIQLAVAAAQLAVQDAGLESMAASIPPASASISVPA